MVHAVDAHSNKSALIPPPLLELERLAERLRLHVPAAAPKDGGGVIRSLRRRFASHVIAELMARYGAGEDTPALSREYGLSKTGLLQLFREEGVSLRRRSVVTEDTNRAVQLYESGLTIDEVVKQIGYSYSTSRDCFTKKAW